MKKFTEDVKDYLEGKTTKQEFIENMQKGSGTNDSNGAYNIDEASYEARNLSSELKTYHWSYAESKLMVEALDKIIYTKDKPKGLEDYETGSLLFEDYYARPTRAACLALEAMHNISMDKSGRLAIENFYKEQERKPLSYSLTRFGNHNGILNYEYALTHEYSMAEDRSTKARYSEEPSRRDINKAMQRIRENQAKNQKLTSEIRTGMEKSTPIRNVSADAPFKTVPAKHGKGMGE